MHKSFIQIIIYYLWSIRNISELSSCTNLAIIKGMISLILISKEFIDIPIKLIFPLTIDN